MARFANEMIQSMNRLIHNELAGKLGDSTHKLSCRIGLNSGPVTAGVLR